MTMGELSAQAANLQRAIQSPTKCTSTTVETLKAVLLPEPSKLPQARTTHAKSNISVPVDGKYQSRIKTKRQNTIAICEDVGQDHEAINIEERIVLATNIVNHVLKSLTNAAQNAGSRAPLRSKRISTERSSSGSAAINCPTSRSETPLQSICGNQNITPCRNLNDKCLPADGVDRYDSGLKAQARCAQVAFASLRFIHDQGKRSPRFPALQLEKGMSALVQKLVAIGFNDLALKEIRILKSRLSVIPTTEHQQIESRKYGSKQKSRGQCHGASKESIAGLLRVGHKAHQGPALSLVITTQLQILKILTSVGVDNPDIILEQLSSETPNSLVNLIQRKIASKHPDEIDKAVGELENVAQLVLRICKKVLSEAMLSKVRLGSVSAEQVLQMQTAALAVRGKWWELARHKVDEAKDAFVPLNRFLESFKSIAQSPKLDQYRSAQQAFEAITTLLQPNNIPHTESVASTYQILAEFAQAAGQFKQGALWIQRGINSSQDGEISTVQRCAMVCQKIILQLRLDADEMTNLPDNDTLRSAADQLAGDLHGDPTNLDQLLVVVTSLRKSLVAFIITSKLDCENGRSNSCPEMITKCLQIVSLSVNFTVRYLGSSPNQEKNERAMLRYAHRTGLILAVARSMIDAVSSIVRYHAWNHVREWTMIYSAVNDCIELAESLKNLEDLRPDQQHSVTEIFKSLPRLSDSLWHRYVNLKGQCTDYKEQNQCLKASIKSLHLCGHEQQITHSLSKRLEQYGKLHEAARDHTTAFKIYGEALHLNISLGVVAKAAEAASTRSMLYVMNEVEDFRVLARTLDAYCSVASRLRESDPSLRTHFDLEEIGIDDRILLLGYQLSALSTNFRSSSRATILYETAQDISRIMLHLCDKVNYPVQKLYVITQVLSFRMNSTRAVAESVSSSPLEESSINPISPHTKSSLQIYSVHLIQCRDLLVAVHKREPDLKAVEEILTAWARMLHETPDSFRIHTLVYDIKAWYMHLEMIIAFLELQNLQSLRCLALYVYTTISQSSNMTGGPDIVLNLIQLGSQYIKLGHCGLGDKVLQKAGGYLERLEVETRNRIYWHLANAEMALEISNQNGCNDHLDTVRRLLKELENEQGCQTSADRLYFYGLKADTDLLHSKLATAEGNLFEALLFVRLGVKGYRQIWSCLERQQAVSHPEHEGVSHRCQDDSLREGFSALSISDRTPATKSSVERRAPKSTSFWNLVPRLFNGLVVSSFRFAHAGLYPETKYHLDEARKIAEGVNAPFLLAQHLALSTVLTARSGNSKLSKTLLQQAQTSIEKYPIDPDAVILSARLKKLEIDLFEKDLDHCESIMATFDDAMRTLRKMKTWINSTHDSLHPLIANYTFQNSDTPPIQDQGYTSRRQAKFCTAASKRRSKKFKSQVEAQILHTDLVHQVDAKTQPLCQAEGKVLLEQAIAALSLGEADMGSSLLEEFNQKPRKQQDTILQVVLLAEISLRKAIHELALHPIFNILPESTISHPAICRPGKVLETHEINRRIQGQTQQPKQASSRISARKPEVAAEEKHVQLLHSTHQGLVGVLDLAQKSASNSALHHMLDVLSRTIVILTALPTSFSFSVHPTFLNFTAELGRMASIMQGSLTIRVEKRLIELPRYDFPNKFNNPNLDGEVYHGLKKLDVSSFEDDYISIIPTAWDVLSMTLSESKEEVLICKTRSNETPFTLRIPLNRQSGLDCDESLFGFVEAKHELQDIVDLANRSSQDARSCIQKTEKRDWWTARNALDSRIQNLLANIENTWLGGFRGIFSQHRANSAVLARFHQSLQSILDKHLPSRRTSGKSSHQDRINLESQVLELFVGLGSPSDTNDLDDQILDLVYFVVDILQFNGERNAYDEIDFDSIVIEILDAMRQYHQSADMEGDEQRRHTILILDKKLHCFPWESLSCMKRQSISRLPSLLCLRQRILHHNKQQEARSKSQQNDEGLRVRRQKGAFVLNPAGDLSNTQGNFECNLQGLSGWEGVMEREPQETEFKDYLENQDIFLYFGHGSGNQYIRSRTIKRLDKCAVSLLMGCSSGALTEAGEFEPYGTPIDYMHAGCPALLANLWDVTDKDIDRFAQSVLEKWGLFGQGQGQQVLNGSSGSPVKKTSRQRGKFKAREAVHVDEERKAPVSLDEAVAQSRDACILKYLNGAAPVIYGIPVFLD